MTMRSPFTCVLWDVDGTLVDASDGILRRLTTALEHFGKPAPTRDELVHWIGPPMFNSFQDNVGMTPEQATEAVAYYRTLGKADGYTTGARLYRGWSRSSPTSTLRESLRRRRARSRRCRSSHSWSTSIWRRT